MQHRLYILPEIGYDIKNDVRGEPMEKSQKKKAGKILYYSLIVLFAGIFLFCAVYVGYYYFQAQRSDSINTDLQSLKGTIPATEPKDPDDTQPEATQGETEPAEPTVLPEYQALYELNNDLVGWLTIPDTNIDYPVMQSTYEKDFYLHRDFYKNYLYAGTLYARETCDVFEPSDNVTVYGHRMEKPGRNMFFELDKLKSKTWWESHPTFSFDTIYERHTYEIICVFKTHAKDGYPYHRFENAKTEAEFDEFITKVKSMQFYETGVTAEYGDKLLCLSTCEYSLGDGRFVVVAKRIK